MQPNKNQAEATSRASSLKDKDHRGRERTKAPYRKPVLKRLGLLRSVAGSDPYLPGSINY